MTGTRPPAIPDDITVIPAHAPQDAHAVAATVAAVLAAASTAGIPLPGYVHQHSGSSPSAGLQFTTGTGQDPWEALRAWARHHATTVTATESPARPGTYTARARFHHDGIEFEAYATVTTPITRPQETTP